LWTPRDRRRAKALAEQDAAIASVRGHLGDQECAVGHLRIGPPFEQAERVVRRESCGLNWRVRSEILAVVRRVRRFVRIDIATVLRPPRGGESGFEQLSAHQAARHDVRRIRAIEVADAAEGQQVGVYRIFERCRIDRVRRFHIEQVAACGGRANDGDR